MKHAGGKVCIVFEDAMAPARAGTIKAITERVRARAFRVVALPAPTDYSRARDDVFRAIDASRAPWYAVPQGGVTER